MGDISLQQVYASGKRGRPTVTARPDFNAENAAKGLKEAMEGSGTDEFSIVMILGTCNSEQRQAVKTSYKAQFGKDIIEDLQSELSGEFRKLVTFCLDSWDELYARRLFDAIDGVGTKEEVIILSLCLLSPDEIEAVKEAYKRILAEEGADSSRDLESDIKGDLGGDFENLIVALLQCQRDSVSQQDLNDYHQGQKKLSDIINAERAAQDAEDLYNAGEGKWGTNESTFISVFANRNKFSLWATNEMYKEKYESSLVDVVRSETSGNFGKALEYMYLAQLDPIAVYVKILRNAMDGAGTSDKKLMSVIVDRSEIDLRDIMEAYEAETGESLADRISSETSGDYRRLLLCLCAQAFE